ncbi:hypothetical protein LTR53_012943 [Teratosphaeriaceae sp. CCFEE 6253]|nr:hypothetical protein LTR53_012943 [Teratosphaeriaceae sp. CCFEE 6253]
MYYAVNTVTWDRFAQSFGVDPYARKAGFDGGQSAVVRWAKAIGQTNRGHLKEMVLRYGMLDQAAMRDAELALQELVSGDGVVRSEEVVTVEEFWWNIRAATCPG